MIELEIRPMRANERIEAAGVAARAMRDNPIHVVVFGPDPDRRVAALDRIFRALFRVAPAAPLIALRGGFIVGVCGAAPPGTCRLSVPAWPRVLIAMARNGLGPFRRTLHWLEAWSQRDPAESHWHVGPVAVDGGLQGLGIGSRMLAALETTLDAGGEPAWLETDKPENTVFYQRAGFTISAEAEILGTRCWFLTRHPRRERGRVGNVDFSPLGKS